MVKEIKSDEVVSIKKDELAAIMERVKRLEFAADKAHLAHFDEKNKGQHGKSIRLRMINGKVVLSWDNMIENLVEKNPAGVWSEKQTIKIYYEDKTSEEMDLVIFNRRFTHIKADVISETTMSDAIVYKVRTEDGREYEINSQFIN